jgi:hypothetical protein
LGFGLGLGFDFGFLKTSEFSFGAETPLWRWFPSHGAEFPYEATMFRMSYR